MDFTEMFGDASSSDMQDISTKLRRLNTEYGDIKQMSDPLAEENEVIERANRWFDRSAFRR